MSQYVDFSCAKLLKENGFDELCVAYYNTNDVENVKLNINDVTGLPTKEKYLNSYNKQQCEDKIDAPSFQQVNEYLKKKYNALPFICTNWESNTKFFAMIDDLTKNVYLMIGKFNDNNSAYNNCVEFIIQNYGQKGIQ